MSFVPVSGTALFRPGDPPREGVVEFADARRTVALPMRAALPVLTRAHQRDDLHASVRLLTGAALLGVRLVAAGCIEPATGSPGGSPSWRIAPLDDVDAERVRLLARARAHDHLDEQAAEELVRAVLDAVADALPRTPPVSTPPAPAVSGDPGERGGASRGRPRGDFAARLQARIDRHRPDREPAQLVRLSLRVEADEEELVAGAVRVVLQVHDERDPLRVTDAALLWAADPADLAASAAAGFGERARTHAAIALRSAAEAWPVLERLLELRVPDEITLLDHGVGALDAAGVEVMWPRSLGRDLMARTVLDHASRAPAPRQASAGPREEPLQQPILGTEALFSFRWQVALAGDPLTDDEMAVLAAAAGPVVKLRGAWMVVDPAVARRARRRLVRTLTPVQAVAAALSGVVQVEDAEHEVVVGASLLKVRERLLDAGARERVPVPAGLQASLRGYQREGLDWLVGLTDLGLGACLADDMGLGKTVTVIALHLHRAAAAPPGEARPTLVVCPASLLGNWEAEIARFAPGVAVRRFHGGARSLADLEAGDAGGFVLTTYGTMRVSTDALGEVGWGLVVADEAQHVKNPRSSTARALRTLGLAPGAPPAARVALTGTPVENELTELWAILDWAIPGLLGSRNAFRKAWAQPIEAGVDPALTRRFTDLVGPFLLRRRKSDPGIAPELPAKTETDHPLALTREQAVLYETFVRDTMERVERADEHTRRGLVLALLTGLKQICNHPAHFLKQSGSRLAGRSEKLDLVDELLDTVLAEGGGALVFTQYVAMARLLEAHLSRAGVPVQLLHGGTPVREREAMVARFQAAPEGEPAPVFLLSLKAGGTGLNLTRADHVVHFDRWWNPAVEEQATDRAYRIGQTKPVQVHRLITRGTIEERIDELLTRKRSIADAVLARGESALTELSDADLRDFVSLRPHDRA